MSDTKPRIAAHAIGRRREAIASVRLYAGTGVIEVNERPIDKYFPGLAAKARYSQPFKLLGVEKYDATVRTHGGGPNGQLDATVLGLSRCLADIKDEYHKLLSVNGFMSRDSRIRERRKVGTGGKARRGKQSPKR